MSEQDVTVELFYSSAWNDHTSAVDMDRGDIRITQGATDAYSHAQPASCQLVFDNRDGTFNPKNPTSSLYGLIGRNTPIRVSVEGSVRFSGEVASWTPRRGVKKDAWTNVVATGITRRLGQGVSPLRPALTRAGEEESLVVGYWPMEGLGTFTGQLPAVAGSPLQLGEPDLPGDPIVIRWSNDREEPGLGACPSLTTEETDFEFVGSQSAASEPFGLIVWGRAEGQVDDLSASVSISVTTDNDWRWTFGRTWFDDGGANPRTRLFWVVRDDTNTIQWAGNGPDEDLTNRWIAIGFLIEQDGADMALTGYTNAESVALTNSTGDGTGITIGNIVHIEVDIGGVASIGMKGRVESIGHPTLLSGGTAAAIETAIQDLYTAGRGTPDEHAGTRIVRLCGEEDVTVTVTGTASDTVPLGPQVSAQLLDLLREAAAADSGILHDAVTQFGFTYRTGRSLYSQDAALTLDWDAGEIAEPLEPVTDDRNVRNDITVRRRDGGTYRTTLDSGPLSIQDPPDGVGRYDHETELSLSGDGLLDDQGEWRLHLGTVDEIRFPRVSIDLDAGTTLASNVNAVRPGDRLDLVNLPPEHVAVDEASLLVLGWTEKIGIHKRKVTFNCTPEAPYRIAEVGGGATLGTVGSTSATLDEDLTTTETGIRIDCGAGPDWDHEGTDYDVLIGGERITVQTVGGGSGTFPNRLRDLDVVVRSVNGVVKTHSSGDPVTMADPAYIGL